jgi:hypothetical protein
MTTRNKLVGERFGMLLVTSFSHVNKKGDCYWVCVCDCGNSTIRSAASLKKYSARKSCGCAVSKAIGTRNHRSKTYRAWSSMRSRCLNSNDARYKHYGAKGISVCPEWETYEQFLTDMGEAPIGLSLDRIDNSEGYRKDNCRWATRLQQNRNTSLVIKVEHDGQIKCITEWAGLFNIRPATLLKWVRLSSGATAISLASKLHEVGLTTRRNPSAEYLTVQVRYPVNADRVAP